MQSWSDLPFAYPPLASALRILLVLVAAWIGIRAQRRVIGLLRRHVLTGVFDADAAKRAETLGMAFHYLVTVAIIAMAVMTVLGEVGVSIAPILGAAGVVGLAVGIGAQSLVKDYFNGFFLLLEDQLRQGDVVRIAGLAGLVERVTLRHVRLRDEDGSVHFVPNNLVTTVSNMSKDYAHAIIEVSVPYRESVDEAFDLTQAVGRELRADPRFAPRILGDLEIAGVERWEDSAVVLRGRFKVAPLQQWEVRREFMRRLRRALDQRRIATRPATAQST